MRCIDVLSVRPAPEIRLAVSSSSRTTAKSWRRLAIEAEEIGCWALFVPDHLDQLLSPFGAAIAAGLATTRLRVGTLVLNATIRHPALVAREAVSADVLTEGRFELGIGAGWARSDFAAVGVPMPSARERLARLADAVDLLHRALTGGAVEHRGPVYSVSLTAGLRPRQRPRPPITIGGTGPRLLHLAGELADTVNFNPRSRDDGSVCPVDVTLEATQRKVDAVRQAAVNRVAPPDLSVVVIDVNVSARTKAAVRSMSSRYGVEPSDLQLSPHFLVGSTSAVVEQLTAARELLGISTFVVPVACMSTLGPVIAAL